MQDSWAHPESEKNLLTMATDSRNISAFSSKTLEQSRNTDVEKEEKQTEGRER